jgi:hypothetical protein
MQTEQELNERAGVVDGCGVEQAANPASAALARSITSQRTQTATAFHLVFAFNDFLAFLTRLCGRMALVSFGDRDRPRPLGLSSLPPHSESQTRCTRS